jgi:hypothetical protein
LRRDKLRHRGFASTGDLLQQLLIHWK